MKTREERLQGLAIDVDTRLAAVWALAWERDTAMAEALEIDWLAECLGTLLRAAYGVGYCDALREDSEGRRGELHRANGYRVPARRFTT